MRKRRGSGAFTLIELLIVAVILGILAAIAIPNFQAAMVRAKISALYGKFRTLQNALAAYELDHGALIIDDLHWNEITNYQREQAQRHNLDWVEPELASWCERMLRLSDFLTDRAACEGTTGSRWWMGEFFDRRDHSSIGYTTFVHGHSGVSSRRTVRYLIYHDRLFTNPRFVLSGMGPSEWSRYRPDMQDRETWVMLHTGRFPGKEPHHFYIGDIYNPTNGLFSWGFIYAIDSKIMKEY